MSFMPFLPLATRVVEAMLDGTLLKRNPSQKQPARPQSGNDEYAKEAAKLLEELAKQREATAKLREGFEKLSSNLEQKKIETFEQLAQQDKEAMRVLIELAWQTPAAALQGVNVAFFGLISIGKSTMLNALLGQNLVETGVGGTTVRVKAYSGNGYTLWDIPGRHDERSYMSMEYISLLKGLSRRLILIGMSVRENSSLMKLLDELQLEYDIVFNKFDLVDEENRSELKEQIKKEIQTLGLKKIGKVYFVSAKYPRMFDDWRKMNVDLAK